MPESVERTAESRHSDKSAMEVDSKANDGDVEKGAAPDGGAEPEEPKSAAEEDHDKIYPAAKQTAVIMIALYMTIFLVSLDRTILATAIPQITDEFHSIDDIGWYASAYMMTACAFQLLFGKIYTFYSSKWVFLASIAIFELGSLLCAVAPNSPAFVVGRAVAGLGSAGVMAGMVMLTVDLIPLRKRPMWQGVAGCVMLVSAVVGPLIGGAFTTKLTWRWCFYINLPVGGAAILVMAFLLPANGPARVGHKDDKPPTQKLSLREKFEQLDPIGTLCFLPGIVCLLLALQWGGSTYAWSDARIIVLWVLFGLLTIAFAAVQVWKQDKATLPPRILKYRSVTASTWFAFCISGSMTTVSTFLPLWFQAIQDVNAIDSGIRLLPFIAALIVASIIAGGGVSAIGYYTPFLILCSIIMSVGAGLLTTLRVDASQAIWVGYQIIFGFGTGLGQQQAGLAAQTVLPSKDVPVGVSLKFFGQLLGGAIFVSVGQNVLSQRLVSGLTALNIEGLDPSVIVSLGATELRHYVPEQYLEQVLRVYNDALDGVFLACTVLAALSITGALLTEWKSVKGKAIGKGGGGA